MVVRVQAPGWLAPDPPEPTGPEALELGVSPDDLLAVWKPTAGERPLADFPAGTLTRREVAAFAVS